MVRHDAVYLEVPAHLSDVVEDVIHRLSYVLEGYDLDVVEDAHRLPELLDLYKIHLQCIVKLYPLWLDLVEALVLRETGRIWVCP